MMKKRFTFLAVLAAVLSFAFATACGGGGNSSSSTSSLPESSSSVEDSSSSEEDSSSESSVENENAYTIYYFLTEADQTECKIQLVEKGEVYTLTTNVQRTGYVLSYWKDKATGQRYYPQNGEWTWTQEDDMCLVGVWELDWAANPGIKDDDKWSDFYV